MTSWTKFVESLPCARADDRSSDDRRLKDEYDAMLSGCALLVRSRRRLLEVTGSDRLRWLHNVTTNQVANLGVDEGQYAFALNQQGRILFDLNILVREHAVWVDVDAVYEDRAKAHFDKYVVVEDVTVSNTGRELVRLALVGPAAVDSLDALGASHVRAMPSLGTTSMTWNGAELTIVRHDFCGPFGVEMLVPERHAVGLWRHLTDFDRSNPAVAAGEEAAEVHRIETGIARSGHEITEEYLPAETGQFERAVSTNKGCYLGQEIVERMRSRGAVARQLRGLAIDGAVVPAVGSILNRPDGTQVGRLTSSCRSFAKNRVIGMGYVKTEAATAGSSVLLTWEDSRAAAEVVDLPIASLSSI